MESVTKQTFLREMYQASFKRINPGSITTPPAAKFSAFLGPVKSNPSTDCRALREIKPRHRQSLNSDRLQVAVLIAQVI